MPPTSSTVIAWELGIRMREAREQVGISGVKAAKHLGVSQNYLSDVEHGKRRLTQETLIAAIPAYGIPEPEQEELWVLRDQVDQRGWWSKYTGIFAPEVLRYFGLEHGAESIQIYENLAVPGLLQTEAYAYAMAVADTPNIRFSEAGRRVKARMLRQRRLVDDDPLKLTVLLSQGALKQQVGGADVLADQLRYLLSLVDDKPDTLDLRVLPFEAGAYATIGASTFHMLTFANTRLPTIAYQESITLISIVNHPDRVHEYGQSYQSTLQHAADRERSVDLIRDELRAIT